MVHPRIQISEMLRHSRELVRKRTEHRGFRKLFLPQIRWRKWLYSGGEEEESLPASSRRTATQQRSAASKQANKLIDGSEENLLGKKRPDLESAVVGAKGRSNQPSEMKSGSHDKKREGDKKKAKAQVMAQPVSLMLRIRGRLADILEWMQHSEDLSYAFKLTIATYLVTFPALVPSLNAFYAQRRGSECCPTNHHPP